jgi:hypothetical protein
MAAFIQWLVVVAVAFVAFVMVLDRLDRFEDEKKARALRVAAFALFATVVLCPFYYEAADWGSSVPVTFAADGSIIEHPYGMFTPIWGGEYTNLPNGGATISSIASVELDSNRNAVHILVFSARGAVASPKKYFEMHPNKRFGGWSSSILEDARNAMDSLLVGFLDAQALSARNYRSMSQEQRAAFDDTVGIAFDKWVDAHRQFDGIAMRMSKLRIVTKLQEVR